jgi:hypothetical protein
MTDMTEDHHCGGDNMPEDLIPVRLIEKCSLAYFKSKVASKIRKVTKQGPPYVSSFEKLPAHPYFESVNETHIREILYDLQKIVNGHLEKAENKGYDRELETFKAMTESLAVLKCTNGVTALCLGAQASGKSSLINSLLDSRERICNTGGGPFAVTTCPMSFQSSEMTRPNESLMHTTISKEAERSATTSDQKDPVRTIVSKDVNSLKTSMQDYTAGVRSIITKSIDVQFEAPVLRSGLRVVDLPGTLAPLQ